MVPGLFLKACRGFFGVLSGLFRVVVEGSRGIYRGFDVEL